MECSNYTVGYESNCSNAILTQDISLTTPLAEKRIDDYFEYKLSVILFLYVSPVLIILGTLGNGLSFGVLHTKTFRKSSVGFVLRCLAVADALVLNVVLLRMWILHLTHRRVDVRLFSAIGCKVHVFLSYLLPQLSSWLLVILTVERLISVAFPLRAHMICSRRNVAACLLLLVVVLSGLNAHFFWTFEYSFYLRPTEKHPKCFVKTRYITFWRTTWYWLDMVMLSLIPLVVISAMNAAIIALFVTYLLL